MDILKKGKSVLEELFVAFSISLGWNAYFLRILPQLLCMDSDQNNVSFGFILFLQCTLWCFTKYGVFIFIC